MTEKTLKSFEIFLIELEKICDKLSEFYLESNNLYNHKVGIFKIYRKLVFNLRFALETANISPQQITHSLGRLIIDQYSILYFLSNYSTRNEQLLRYYLFLIDSLESRMSTISEFSDNFTEMSEIIINQNIISNSHDLNVIKKIRKLIIEKGLNEITNEKNITNSNWKFESAYKSKNGHSYNWQELYNIAKIPPHFAKSIQNHFSTFTHGLGMTILYSEDKPESTIYIYEFVNLIQTIIGKLMIVNYPDELKDLELRKDFIENGEIGWKEWK